MGWDGMGWDGMEETRQQPVLLFIPFSVDVADEEVTWSMKK
jgi:hypothetical protein